MRSTTTARVATAPLGAPRRAQRAFSTALSVVVHSLVLIVLAATSVRIVTPVRDIIPLVIRSAPPPPPPPGPGTPEGAPVAVAPQPPIPVPVEQPKKIPPKVAQKPKKIAAHRPPNVAKAEPSPAANESLSAPAAEAVPAVPAGGGVVGGVVGGTVGGKVGGRVGGTGDDAYTADQVAVPPKVIKSVTPDYPVVARARGVEGVVILQGIVDRSGAVEEEHVTVLQSQSTFDDSAIKAFRKWRFTPGRNDQGEAVRVVVRQPIRFQLR